MDGQIINVLHISVRSDRGGGPKYLNDFLKVVKSEYPLINSFVASPLDEPYGPEYKKVAEKFFYIPARKFSIIKYLKLIFFVKKNKIHVVHSHGRGAGIYSRMLKLVNVKVIHTFHGLGLQNSLPTKIKNMIEKLFKFLTDIQVFVSQDEYKLGEALNIVKKNVGVVISNGIDINEFKDIDSEMENSRLKEVLKIPNTGILLGTLARLDPVKGIDLLIKNFYHLEKKGNDNLQFFLVVGGSGEQMRNLVDLVKSLKLEGRIFFLGEIEKGIEFISQLDIYVSNSKTEGMPLSVLEAMALRKPCVLSRRSGHIGIVNDGLDGYLFEFDSPTDFYSKINLAFKNPQIGYNAHVKIVNNYQLKSTISKTVNCYQSVAL